MHALGVRLFFMQLTTTLLMTGLIWFVQIVHYPLFAHIGRDSFVPYEQRHARFTGYVVGAPMLLELATALAALAPSLRPSFLSAGWAAASVLLLGAIWGATGLLQVPLHDRLGKTWDPVLIKRLVHTNWIRTAGWSLRSVLLLVCLSRALESAHAQG